MEHNDSTQPPQSDISHKNKDYTNEDNPFFVGLDEDIFKVKEMEAQARKKAREENQKKNIWEKSLPASKKIRMKNEIKKMQREIFEMDSSEKKEIGLIEAADNALKNRIVQRDQMQKFIEKKREMFLMQMTIDQKKEQIKQQEEQIHNKEMGIFLHIYITYVDRFDKG